MINRVYRCRMIAIVIWSLFQVTTVIGQASQNQLPDGKLCLFTCSEWIFEEKVAQFAPSANLLGPGQLSKHTIGLPCDHGSDSQTSSNGPNYHNVWGAVYIIDKNECDAVIKQSQSEYETPFLSNEDVIVVKHGEMNCLTVDLGIQPGDHPPRHHPNNILPNTNQDEAYYEQLAKLGVPQDYINGLQLASQRNRHHPIIPRDYHPARYNKKPNFAPNNQLPNQISRQPDDVLPSVTVKVPHQQNLYPNQDYVEITPLELPGGEDEPISLQRTSPQVPEVNQRPNQRKVISPKPMQVKPYSSEESSEEEEEEPELTSVQPNPTIPSRSIKNAPAPINLQKPVQSAPNLTEDTPKLIPAQPSNPLPGKFIPNAQNPIIENTQPKSANYSPPVTQKLVDQPVNENDYSTPEVGQPIESPKSSDSPRPLVIPQTARKPKISQSSTPKVIPASNTSNVSSPPISSGTTSKSVSSAKDTENVPLTNNEVDEAPSVVVITPFKNPGMVATPADVNQNQPYERTQSLKPQNNLPKSGVLGFPKSNNSPTLTTQQGKNPTVLSPTIDSTTPTVVINPNHPVSENNGGDKTPSIVTAQSPITDTKTPTVLVNPNHLVSGSPRGKTPTVLISPNESSPKVNVLDEQQPQVISPEVKLPHNPNSSPTISPDQNGGNLSGPNLPPDFIIGENLPVLPDEPMFIPNNKDSVPSILADFATTDTPPELPDQPMFLPEDEFYVRSLPSDFGTKNNLSPQPNQPTSISTENNSLLPLLSDFSTTDTPTLLPDQPMFIPEENNSLHSIPPHIATTEKPESLPDEPMFIPDDNIQDNTTKHVPQQVNPSSPVITPSHPHPTGYIPKSILDEEHAQKNNDSPVVQNPPQASKIKPLPQRNEQLVKPIIPDTTNVSKVPSDSNIQPYATGLLPKSTDDHPAQSLKPATPVKVLDTPIVVVEPTPTKQPHATGFKPEIADTDTHPTQPILLKSPDENRTPIQPSTIKQPRNEVSLNQDTPLIASTPSTTTNDQPHATGFKPEIAEKDTRPTQRILPAPINVKQPSNEVPPVTNTQPNTTGVVLKPTVEKENNPVEPVQSVTPVKQKSSQQVIPPSSSQVHTTGLQPKLAKDQSSGPTQPVQPVIPVKQSSLPSNAIESQPKSIGNQDNPVSSEEQVPITIPQDNQNSGSSSNYDPSTFMVPNYSPDSSFLGYTFGTYFPQYIQKYDPQYEPSNCVYSPEEFVPGFTFGGHCQLY